MNVEGISAVGKDTALSANLDGLSLSSTSTTIERGSVNTALSDVVSADSDVTIFTPVGSPRVSDKPVVTEFFIRSVTNEVNGVVNVNVLGVVATIEDTRFVEGEL